MGRITGVVVQLIETHTCYLVWVKSFHPVFSSFVSSTVKVHSLLLVFWYYRPWFAIADVQGLPFLGSLLMACRLRYSDLARMSIVHVCQ